MLLSISIITPSFNQGEYLEETINSVLGQGYDRLQYIVIDGGSSDNSVEIIKKYEKYLYYWESVPDNGQAHAINKGLRRSTGDIVAWLNSDDMYLPGTLMHVSDILQGRNVEDENILVFGNALHMDQANHVGYASDVIMFHSDSDISLHDYIIQPSSFATRSAYRLVGNLDESLFYGFDWQWYATGYALGVEFIPTDKFMSIYRIHSRHKTGAGGKEREEEIAKIYRKLHSNSIAEAYLKLKRSEYIHKIERLAYKLRINKCIDPQEITRKIFFNKLDRNTLRNIRKM